MKIPTSSSIILATLAISSSSASLAAPTGDVNTGSGGSLNNAGQAMENEEMADSSMVERDMGTAGDIEGRDLVGMTGLGDILAGIPVVGPLISPLLAVTCPDPNNPNAQSASADPAAVQRLQDAVGTVSSVLQGAMPTGVPLPGIPVSNPLNGAPAPPGPLQGIVGAQDVDPGASGDPNDPSASLSGPPFPEPTQGGAAAAGDDSNDGSFLISPTTTIANAQEASQTQDSSYLSATEASEPTSAGDPSGPSDTPIPATTAPPSA